MGGDVYGGAPGPPPTHGGDAGEVPNPQWQRLAPGHVADFAWAFARSDFSRHFDTTGGSAMGAMGVG